MLRVFRSWKGHYITAIFTTRCAPRPILTIALIVSLAVIACEEQVPDTAPRFTERTIADQEYTVGEAIGVLVLPEATGGDGELIYTLLPSVPGLTFDASTRRLTGTPTAAGTYRMAYTVEDGDADSDVLTFTITIDVVGPPGPSDTEPSFGGQTVPDQTYTVGTTISPLVLPDATGGDGELVYTLLPSVPGLTFDASTRRLTGTPTDPGTYALTYAVADADENTAPSDADTLSFIVTVEPEPEPDPGLGLMADRDILLAAQYVLHGDGLGWDASLPVEEWAGVYVSGTPKRVTGLSLHSGLTGDLTGVIPASLGDLSELDHLYLGSGLSGEIPASLGNLSKLTTLHLGLNDLTGEVPASLGRLSDLYSLSLRYNDLSGEIPAWLANLSKLHFLDLDGSGLDGCLPSALRTTLNRGGSDLDWYSFCDDVRDPLPEPESAFDIDLHFLGLTASAIGRSSANGRNSGRVSVVRDEIERAATWWESKITGDVADEAIMASECGHSVEWFIEGQTIDDLAVIVEIGTDAPRTGARAFVCATRAVGGLPVLARVVVHEDWLRSVGESYPFSGPGRIERLLRHELGHALGFTRDVFGALGLTRVAGGHWRFTGATARAWFPRTGLPWSLDDVREHGVPLTSDQSHLPFRNQLMSASAPWEQSTLTLAMMADLGYRVPAVAAPW